MKSITLTGSYDTSYDITQNVTAPKEVKLYNLLPFPLMTVEYSLPALEVGPNSPISIPLTKEDILSMERRIFEKNKKKYLEKYEGQYIAIHNGKLIGRNDTFAELSKKIREKYGTQCVFMTRLIRDKKHRMPPKFKSIKNA